MPLSRLFESKLLNKGLNNIFRSDTALLVWHKVSNYANNFVQQYNSCFWYVSRIAVNKIIRTAIFSVYSEKSLFNFCCSIQESIPDFIFVINNIGLRSIENRRKHSIIVIFVKRLKTNLNTCTIYVGSRMEIFQNKYTILIVEK